MELHLDADGVSPPFEQVRAGVVEQLAAGALLPGDRLPTVRGLAEQLGLAPGTVARAYRELEADGVVETRGRAGTFVVESTDPTVRAATAAARAYAEQTARLGVPAEQAVELAARALGLADQRGAG